MDEKRLNNFYRFIDYAHVLAHSELLSKWDDIAKSVSKPNFVFSQRRWEALIKEATNPDQQTLERIKGLLAAAVPKSVAAAADSPTITPLNWMQPQKRVATPGPGASLDSKGQNLKFFGEARIYPGGVEEAKEEGLGCN